NTGSGGALADTDAVSITVSPVNDRPVAADGAATASEEAAKLNDLGALVSDDETGNANLTCSIVAGPSHGGLSGSGASRTYTPAANFNGSDSFTYNVTDRGVPDNCAVTLVTPCAAAPTSYTEAVSITVSPVNDRPVAADG